jgi:septal ring factor EnvC (AmiA/AmiB activator)
MEPPPPLTNQQQDLLNKAVKSHGNHGGPRSSFNVFSHDTPIEVVDKSPAGIIDLECYSSVHRSADNQLLLELAGDESVNPDLRQFYFYSPDEQESVDWTQALLSYRHSSLQDELDAFREVASGFASQLQEIHSDLDDTKEQLAFSQEECYKVRSAAEEVRRTGFRLVREALERNASTTATFNEARKAYRQDLETAREMGLVPAVQLLGEYTRVLEETCLEQYTKMQELEKQMRNSTDNDATYVKSLQETLSSKEQEWMAEKKALEQQVATMQQALQNSQKSLEDAQQELSGKRLEMTMYQTSTKNRLGELLHHKTILKKEVIGLRQKLDEVGSELSLHKHTAKTSLQTVNE